MPSSSPHINWSNIETVLLDMDGTLLDLYFDWHFWMTYLPQIYAQKNHCSEAEATEFVHQKIKATQGTLNWYCLDYWTETFDLPIASLKREIKHLIKIHPDVIEFLTRLKAQQKTIIMVTNAHPDSLTLKLEMTDIGPYFDAFISAHDLGIPKEDPAIWDKIQQQHPFNPKTTLLIDDNISALKTAKAYGIQETWAAIHVSPKMDKVDPQGFPYFEHYADILPE